MAEAKGRLWISQAHSDRWAAERLYDRGDPRSYCQVIAKCQQTVEKSVKAVAAALRDHLDFDVRISYGHEVDRMAFALRRPVKPDGSADLQQRVNKVFADHRIAEIQALEALIPRRPAQRGDLHARNTEYPFELAAGVWTAPALNGFTDGDVRRFTQLANHIYDEANRIVLAAERGTRRTGG